MPFIPRKSSTLEDEDNVLYRFTLIYAPFLK